MAKKKLKIAIVNYTQKQTLRGGEIFVDELSRRLRKRHIVHVLHSDKPLGRRLSIVWRTYLDLYGISILRHSVSILPRLRSEHYDIVMPINSGWQALVVRIYTAIFGGKVVISGQSGAGWDDRINLLSFPDAYVALSVEFLTWAKRFNPFVRVEKIPNGVDVKSFARQKQTINHGLKKPVILCVSALVSAKRIHLAINSASKIEDASLLVVGSGPLKCELERLGNKKMPGRLKIMSLIHKDMPKAYKSADLFTFPTSRHESFGIVLVEAMASGLPVVATRDPIRREIVGQAGVLVDPENTEEYVRSLRLALKKDWGSLPQKQAAKFDWDDIAEKYEQLFYTLLN